MIIKNKNQLKKQAPIIIGGVGGSGTRVVAEILEKSGCFIGKNLNFAYDNMDFSFCFNGRISWLKKSFPFDQNNEAAKKYLTLFKKIYFQDKPTLSDRFAILRIGLEYLRPVNFSILKTRPVKQRISRAVNLFYSQSKKLKDNNYIRWGFKNPGSIFLLNPLISFFPDLTFIHVIRDGRDMALSQNKKQTTHHAPLFGLPKKSDPLNSLKYWGKANTWVYEICRQKLAKKNYLIIRFEDLCLDPKKNIDKLLNFTHLKKVKDKSIYSLPQKIPSMGRWKKHAQIFKGLNEPSLKLFGYK